MKGRITSEKTKEKLRRISLERGFGKWMKGKHASLETRKKMKDSSRKGDKCHLWKGGITPINRAIRSLFEYRQWRSDVYKRDNYTCVWCSARSGNGKAVYLEAHHIKEFYKIVEEYNIKIIEEALNCEELWDINNGITLCKECHGLTKK